MQEKVPSTSKFSELVALYERGNFQLLLSKALPILKKNKKSYMLNKLIGAAQLELRAYDAAEVYFRRLLKIDPTSAEAPYLLGTVFVGKSNTQEAIKQFQHAVKISPKYFDANLSLGSQYLVAGKYNLAINHFSSALNSKPNDLRSIIQMGTAYHKIGDLDKAALSFQNALSIRAELFEAHVNLGLVFIDQNEFEKALGCFQTGEKIRPLNAHVSYGKACAYKGLGELKKSQLFFENAIKLAPGFEAAIFQLGILEKDAGQLQRAKELFGKVQATTPYKTRAMLEAAIIDRQLGNFEAAIKTLQTLISDTPKSVKAHFQIGVLFFASGEDNLALHHLNIALSIDPELAEAHCALGSILSKNGKSAEACKAYEKALALRPNYEGARIRLIYEKRKTCDWSSSEFLEENFFEKPSPDDAVPPLMALALEDNPEHQKLRSLNFAAASFPLAQNISIISQGNHADRIRLGYFSGDLYDHPVLHVMSGIFREHDKSKFDVRVYSFGKEKSGGLRKQTIENVEQFIDASDWSDKRLVQELNGNPLDVAIDLSGYTDNGRTRVFANRLAPIQINFLGFPSTLGANFIDYIVADEVVIPETHKPFYSEKPLYLKNTFFPNDRTREISTKPTSRTDFDLPHEGFVFCCFNNSFKISALEFDVWMRILKQCNESVLWLASANDAVVSNLKKEAEQRGVCSDRIIFASKLKQNSDHLARHKHADLFLDTFNYNAHTTAADALMTGLPIVTKQGNQFAARVASSLLKAIDLNELVTYTIKEYESLIIQLVNEPAKLEEIKRKLQNRIKSGSAFNALDYTRDFEKKLSSIHRSGQY